MGLPEALSRPKDAAKIKNGNATMAISAKLLRAAARAGAPAVIENPCSSRIWHAPAMRRISLLPTWQATVTDFCQHGTPYRKRTKLWCWNTAVPDSLKKMCSGRHGMCSRSLRPHTILEGVDPVTKRLRTLQANPYPLSFAQGGASMMVDSVERLAEWKVLAGLMR